MFVTDNKILNKSSSEKNILKKKFTKNFDLSPKLIADYDVYEEELALRYYKCVIIDMTIQQ